MAKEEEVAVTSFATMRLKMSKDGGFLVWISLRAPSTST